VSATYLRGDLAGLVSAHTAVLVGAAPESALARRLWPLVAEEAPLDLLLDALAVDGLRNLPGFAVVRWSAGTAVVLVRGDIGVEVHTAGRPVAISGSAVTTWTERRFDTVDRVAIDARQAAGAELPLLGGVVAAGALRITDLTGAASAAVVEDRPARIQPTIVPADDEEPPPFGEPPPLGELPIEGPSAVSTPAPEPPHPIGAPPTGESLGMTADIEQWVNGETVFRASEDAAVRPGDGARPDLIDGVPGMGGPVHAARPADVTGDVELTTRRPPPPDGSGARRGSELVPGVVCDSAHPNPPDAERCRVCAASLAGRPPSRVRRPRLGTLRLSTGGAVPLDRTLIIGRSPTVERVGGDSVPRPVVVPSRDRDISRNHGEVTLDGWLVLVTDLGSANGTVITIPAHEPRRLRPHEPVPIPPGTVVDLAGEASFEYVVGG
jgi:hypothetical protein